MSRTCGVVNAFAINLHIFTLKRFQSKVIDRLYKLRAFTQAVHGLK